jgi:hypothetical protein
MALPKNFVAWLTVLLVLLSFSFMMLSVFGPELGEYQQRMADTINGFLMGSVLSAIVGTVYGTSLGSKDKQAVLDKVIDKITTSPPKPTGTNPTE